ncbi:MAG: thioredoxin domain-containing protein, partial [Nocardioides sp.]|uniref:DsbA family protein n=1 Tax=Nocardioides sp. TaxID=35761 RepID=UPI0039E42545
DLVDLAVKAGAKRSEVSKDILDTSSESDWVKGVTNEALNEAGVTGTPTVYLNGKQYNSGSDSTALGKNLVKAVS